MRMPLNSCGFTKCRRGPLTWLAMSMPPTKHCMVPLFTRMFLSFSRQKDLLPYGWGVLFEVCSRLEAQIFEGSTPSRSAFESLCQQSEVWNIPALPSTDDGFLYPHLKTSKRRPNPGASPNAKALAFNSLVCCKKRISSSKPASPPTEVAIPSFLGCVVGISPTTMGICHGDISAGRMGRSKKYTQEGCQIFEAVNHFWPDSDKFTCLQPSTQFLSTPIPLFKLPVANLPTRFGEKLISHNKREARRNAIFHQQSVGPGLDQEIQDLTNNQGSWKSHGQGCVRFGPYIMIYQV